MKVVRKGWILHRFFCCCPNVLPVSDMKNVQRFSATCWLMKMVLETHFSNFCLKIRFSEFLVKYSANIQNYTYSSSEFFILCKLSKVSIFPDLLSGFSEGQFHCCCCCFILFSGRQVILACKPFYWFFSRVFDTRDHVIPKQGLISDGLSGNCVGWLSKAKTKSKEICLTWW